MLILAIETSADVCSVAVRDSQGTVVERAFRHRMGLSQRLLADVSAVLDDASVGMAQIDGRPLALAHPKEGGAQDRFVVAPAGETPMVVRPGSWLTVARA